MRMEDARGGDGGHSGKDNHEGDAEDADECALPLLMLKRMSIIMVLRP